MKKSFFWVTIGACGLLMYNWKQMRNNNQNKTIQIIFNPEPSAVYEYTISNNRSINHKIGEGILTSDLDHSTAFVLNILKNVDGKLESNVIFNHHNIVSRTNQTGQETEDSTKAFDKAISFIKGLSLAVIYDSHGKITYLQGYHKFKADSDSIFHAYSSEKVRRKPPSESFLTEDYFKALLEKPTNLVFGQTVSLDKSWKSTDKMSLLDEELPIEIENTVTDYRNGILYVQTRGIVNKKLKFISNKFIEIKGTQTGEMEIEVNTGVLLKKIVNIHLFGSTKIGPIEQSITVEDSTIINGVRI